MPVSVQRMLRLAAASVCLLMSREAAAVDLNALDLIPAPPGTDAILSYSTFATRDSFHPENGATIDSGTHLNSAVGILRYVHYMDVGGFTVAPQVLLPYGSLFDARIGGTELDSAAGLADPIVTAPVWLVNNPSSGSYLTVVPYLFIPLGSYDAGDALNLGENRWKFDLQIGAAQDLGNGFTLEAAADVMWYGTNSDATGNGVGTLKQDNTYQAQIWLSYTPPADKSWSFSVGYSKLWGGDQFLNGVANGSSTNADQVRLQVSKFLTPTFQVQGVLQRDLVAEGGFKEDLRATVRLLKVF